MCPQGFWWHPSNPAAFNRLAECHLKSDAKHEAASAFVEAAKVSAKSNPQQSTELLHKAVTLYTDMGRLNMAARQLRVSAHVQFLSLWLGNMLGRTS